MDPSLLPDSLKIVAAALDRVSCRAPGGQGLSEADLVAVEIVLDLDSDTLDPTLRGGLREQLGSLVGADGCFRIIERDERSQYKNRVAALRKMETVLAPILNRLLQ